MQSLQVRLDNCLAEASWGQYRSGVRKFKKFLQLYCPTLQLPMREMDWLLFTEFMIKKEKLVIGTARQYRQHVLFMLECLGYERPSFATMPRLKRVKVQLKGLELARTKKKHPIDWGLVIRLIDSVDFSEPDSVVFCAILTIGVAALLRLGEILISNKKKIQPERVLRKGHFAFYPSRENPKFMSIYLPYSKTDKYGNGITICVPANPNSLYCPVRYALLLTKHCGITDPVFVWPNGTLITKSSFITKLRQHLKFLGIDHKQFSGHSLRRGGAISAKAAGASDALIKLLGRWRSDAYLFYLNHTPAHIQKLNEALAAMRLVQFV